jgi:hypothetical protein
MWEKLKPGNRASKNRSTRMPASSAVTATFSTLVGIGAGTNFCSPSSDGARCGRASKDERPSDFGPCADSGLPDFGFRNDGSAAADLARRSARGSG